MKLLITGGAGNVGSVLVNLALQKGYAVRVVDTLWFNKKIPLAHLGNPEYEFIKGDICDQQLMEKSLHGIDYVIHAAAVVGDPASKLFPDLTSMINQEAAINLIKLCEMNRVKGFVFLSTCSNYGVSDGLATEKSELKPLSLYAETKVSVEQYIMQQAKGVDWVIGRLSTVYGVSPRVRFDLTVNDFAMNGYRNNFLDIFLPLSYRPYVHVWDLARVLLTIIEKFKSVKNNVFNIGFPGENYQKIKIAEAVKKYIPDLKINIVKEGGDLRDYQVDFSKLHGMIKLKREYDAQKCIGEFINVFEQGIINDFDNPVYYNTSPDFSH
ncbi:MAG: NAD(P)-dependent oxidoreductase [Spirochaetales bacterium]|nr:NAD(P)-dependent oxidoreductase [Spirochaetales bacterium]